MPGSPMISASLPRPALAMPNRPLQRLQLGASADQRARKPDRLEPAAATRLRAQADDAVELDRLALALELDLAQVVEIERVGHEALGVGADHDGARLRGGLHACGDVHRVAERRVLVAQVRADVADDDRPGVDPGADAELDAALLLELARELVDVR